MKQETSNRAGPPVSRRSSQAGPVGSRQAIVREIGPPGTRGQTVISEDRDGARWQIECLGEPVDVGARILFMPLAPEHARRGEMTRLIDAPRTRWVCTLRRTRGELRLTAFGGLDGPELRLVERDSKKAEDGTRVVVVAQKAASNMGGRRRRRSSQPRTGSKTQSDGPPGRFAPIPVRVIQVLGMPFEPDSDYGAMVWKHRLTTRFTRRCRLEAEEIDETLSVQELDRRVDLRHLPFITIDPASARDHDDAVYAERRSPNAVAQVDVSEARGLKASDSSGLTWTHRLWVAIADVSHFVEETGWVDAEARRRGNSIYFPDRSIPMLPERLSNDLCSLRPGVDRLALVVELRLTAEGRVVDSCFHEAVMRSRVGLAYEEAARWLSEEREESSAAPPEWADSLYCLAEISDALSRRRRQSGAITLELPEVEILFDEEGRPSDACLRLQGRAHRVIEEAMLAANRAVARALDRADCETIHRVHPAPSSQKLATLTRLLERLGISVEDDLARPGVLAKVLEDVKGMPSEEEIHVAALRSMSQARYEAESRGHYALRFDHYVHFTSPIRRYADLEVHRALKRMLKGVSAIDRGTRISSAAAGLAIWLSGRERVATEVERDARALACCAIMSGREGEHFEARISAVTEYGLFVRLEAPTTSGLIPMKTLEGSWIHVPEDDVLRGVRSGTRLGLGDRIRVRLLDVDADRIRMAFRFESMLAVSQGVVHA